MNLIYHVLIIKYIPSAEMELYFIQTEQNTIQIMEAAPVVYASTLRI